MDSRPGHKVMFIPHDRINTWLLLLGTSFSRQRKPSLTVELQDRRFVPLPILFGNESGRGCHCLNDMDKKIC